MARLLVVAWACCAVVLSQDRPLFRSAAHTVYVYATVQNKDGRLVTDSHQRRLRGLRQRPAAGRHRLRERAAEDHHGAPVRHEPEHGEASAPPARSVGGVRSRALARRSRADRQLRGRGRAQSHPHERQADAAARPRRGALARREHAAVARDPGGHAVARRRARAPGRADLHRRQECDAVCRPLRRSRACPTATARRANGPNAMA